MQSRFGLRYHQKEHSKSLQRCTEVDLSREHSKKMKLPQCYNWKASNWPGIAGHSQFFLHRKGRLSWIIYLLLETRLTLREGFLSHPANALIHSFAGRCNEVLWVGREQQSMASKNCKRRKRENRVCVTSRIISVHSYIVWTEKCTMHIFLCNGDLLAMLQKKVALVYLDDSAIFSEIPGTYRTNEIAVGVIGRC